MQNKPNLRNAKMNINCYSTRDYEEKCLSGQRKNKPNQTQFQTPQRKVEGLNFGSRQIKIFDIKIGLEHERNSSYSGKNNNCG